MRLPCSSVGSSGFVSLDRIVERAVRRQAGRARRADRVGRRERSELFLSAASADAALRALKRACKNPPDGHQLGYLGTDIDPVLDASTLPEALGALDGQIADFEWDSAGNLTAVHFWNDDNDVGAYHFPFVLVALAPFWRAGSYTEWEYGARPWRNDDRPHRFRITFDGRRAYHVAGRLSWEFDD